MCIYSDTHAHIYYLRRRVLLTPFLFRGLSSIGILFHNVALCYTVGLAIECKVKLYKFIQIFSENTNFSSRALVTTFNVCEILSQFFHIRVHICNENVLYNM